MRHGSETHCFAILNSCTKNIIIVLCIFGPRFNFCFLDSTLYIESHGHEQNAWLTAPLQPHLKNANVGPGVETQNNNEEITCAPLA